MSLLEPHEPSRAAAPIDDLQYCRFSKNDESSTGASGSENQPDSWHSAHGDSLAPGPFAPHAPNNCIGTQTLIPKHLDVCVNTGGLRQSLREIDVTHFSGDVELFLWIRNSYREMRDGRMYRTVAPIWLRSPCASSTSGSSRGTRFTFCAETNRVPLGRKSRRGGTTILLVQ